MFLYWFSISTLFISSCPAVFLFARVGETDNQKVISGIIIAEILLTNEPSKALITPDQTMTQASPQHYSGRERSAYYKFRTQKQKSFLTRYPIDCPSSMDGVEGYGVK